MIDPAESAPSSPLVQLFAHHLAAGEATVFSLPGGTRLFAKGEPAEHLYLLRAGRLAVKLNDPCAPNRLGSIRPGEPVGEMALIAGTAHSTEVFALRDSEIVALPRTIFFAAAHRDPQLWIEVCRLLLARARQDVDETFLSGPRVFGFVGLTFGVEVRALAESLARVIRTQGYVVAVVGSEGRHQPTEWFSNLEHGNDFILYAAECGETGWTALLGRQVDRIFELALGRDAPTAAAPAADAIASLHGLTDLILIQDSACRAPKGSEAWARAFVPHRLFQVRAGHLPDLERMARVITGQAVALVLSGGAARAYAHVGAVRALRESGVPIDFVAGVSMGALVCAGVAMGWDDAEMDMRIRKAFVDSSPVDDLTFPLIAMTRGEKVRARLAEHFGEREISYLWLPFFCGSSNLTTGEFTIHRNGLVREAARASLSLPGVLPPFTVRGEVLVDGAVLNNFPADVMRATHLGPIVGVDVGRGRSIEAADVQGPRSWWRWLLTGEWRNGPPIVSLLIRTATVSANRDIAAAHEATDLLVQPEVEAIEVRDWKAYDPAVAAGRRATLGALARLGRPVSELRRMPALADSTAGA